MEVNYTFVQVPKHDRNLSYINIPNGGKPIDNMLGALINSGACINASQDKSMVISMAYNIDEFYIPVKIDQRNEKHIILNITIAINNGRISRLYLPVQTGRYYDFKFKVNKTEKYPLQVTNPAIIEFEITIGNSINTRNVIDLYTENYMYPNYQCSLGKTKLNLCTLYRNGLYNVKGNATASTILKFVGRQSKKTLFIKLWDNDYFDLGYVNTTNSWFHCLNKV